MCALYKSNTIHIRNYKYKSNVSQSDIEAHMGVLIKDGRERITGLKTSKSQVIILALLIININTLGTISPYFHSFVSQIEVTNIE